MLAVSATPLLSDVIERLLNGRKLQVTFDLNSVGTGLNTLECKLTFLLLSISDLACDDVTCLTLHH